MCPLAPGAPDQSLQLERMTWPVYSKRFVGPLKTGTAGTTALYTVPAGKTVVLKFLTICNTSTSVNVNYRVALPTGALAHHVVRRFVAFGSSELLAVNLVMNAGDSLFAWAPEVGADVDFSAHGYEFDNA